MLIPREDAPGFSDLGLVAFTTTREAGSFNLGSAEASAAVFARWWGLLAALSPMAPRLASAHQVHGTDIVAHAGEWRGWLRHPAADGHVAFDVPTVMAVSLADCVPVFIGHPSGAAAILHSGWRGTAAGIASRAVELFVRRGLAAGELVAHLGPAICGRCYVVGPDVYARLTGTTVAERAAVDLRALIASALWERGVRRVSTSASCTRCNNDRFFSHRAGDAGRQLGVIVSRPTPESAWLHRFLPA